MRASLALALAACAPARGDPAPAALPFELVCDSADTDASSTLFCVRLDTRDGDVRAVDLAALAISNGPTRVESAAAPGTFALACDGTSTAATADFRCVRLDRRTGDLLLVGLPRVPITPTP